jgi:mono/diheme cytochrome c family protein
MSASGWFSGLSRGRRVFIISAIVVVILGVCTLGYLIGPGPMDFAHGKRVDIANYSGSDPTGVPVALAHEDIVKRGEYLARAADCAVCHTATGGDKFAGGLAFLLPFGTLYSTNITPDKGTGIGNYTDAEFLQAIHRGVRKDGAHLYPAMPFTSYTYMSDADALAIKAYLFSLAPIHAPAKENSLAFPFNQRWAIAAWSMAFSTDSRFRPNAERSGEWNRGAYLAEALAHCGECHTPRNLAFALDNRKKFGGAVTAGWHAYNVSSDQPSGIGAWHDDDLLAYLAAGHAPGHGTAGGPMGEAVDESFSTLAPDDVKALVTYLRSVPPTTEGGFTAPLARAASSSHREGVNADVRGKLIYEGACVSCHGWSGESSLRDFATLTGARAVNDAQGTNVAQIVINGMKRATPEGVAEMPAFGHAFSDVEIAAVANFVTGRFGNAASALDEKDIARLRGQTSQ